MKIQIWVDEMSYILSLGSVDSFACEMYWLFCGKSVGAFIIACN